jgi:hypothetical protein
MLHYLDDPADNEEVEAQRRCQGRLRSVLKPRFQDPLLRATELAGLGQHDEFSISSTKLP